MLTSLLGIRVILWMGKTIPTPPSSDVISHTLQAVLRATQVHGEAGNLAYT